MRKTIKTLSALVLAFLLLLSFAACEKSAEVTENTVANNAEKDKEVVEELVEDFFDAYTEMDFEKAIKFTKRNSDAYDDIKDTIETMPFDDIADESPELAEAFEEMIKEMFGAVEINIEEIKVHGDKAEVIYATNAGAMEELFDTFEEEGDARLEARLESVSEEELAELAFLSEEEQVQFGMELAVEVMEELFDEMIEEFNDADLEEAAIKLEKNGNNWKITEME